MPAPLAVGQPGWFAHGSPQTGVPYTVVTSDFLNSLQAEILNVLAYAGITPSKTNSAQLLQALQATKRPLATPGNMTFFVSPTGSDSNAGTSSAPLATMQRAVTLIYGYDWTGSSAVIQLQAGTHTTPVVFRGKPTGHVGPIVLTGNSSNPGSVIISVSNAIAIQATLGVFLSIDGVKVQATGTSTSTTVIGYGVYCTQSWVNISNIILGSCDTVQLGCYYGGVLTTNSTAITFTGTSLYGLQSAVGATIYVSGHTAPSGSPVTLLAPVYTGAFANVYQVGEISLAGNTYVGTASGPKYIVTTNAILNTAGGTVPGSGIGSVASGGLMV